MAIQFIVTSTLLLKKFDQISDEISSIELKVIGNILHIGECQKIEVNDVQGEIKRPMIMENKEIKKVKRILKAIEEEQPMVLSLSEYYLYFHGIII